MPKSINTEKLDKRAINWQIYRRNVGVTRQIISELYSNYLRNSRNRTKTTKDDIQRVEDNLIAIRVLSEILKLPQWKVIDLLLSWGLVEFRTKYQALVEKSMEKQQKQLDLLKAIMQIDTANAALLDRDRLDRADELINESSLGELLMKSDVA